MKNTLYLLIASVLFLAACASPTPAPTADPASSTMPALTDPSKPITVSAGETFMIVVESNPSTGYHWEIVGDLTNVEFVSREYTGSEPVIPGSGGVEVWTFKATTAGDTSFVLGNYPPGEGTTYEQQVQFSVTVQ
ncbi:MAG TPA: protease inhibitor I42 family protein [Anaerolineales bacterium]|nr:protease inhibitor I42 family protein [Anaerolineales bacterium]